VHLRGAYVRIEVSTRMTISILIGIAACLAGLAVVREAMRRRDPEQAANIGSVSQNWVAEHRMGRTEDGLR
jgi:hypothetical protein